MAAFPEKVDNGPVVIPPLEVLDCEMNGFGTPQTATE
jgi:hypothetical protein